MNLNFFNLFLTKTNFPDEAKKELIKLSNDLYTSEKGQQLDKFLDLFYNSDFDVNIIKNGISDLAADLQQSIYTIWILFFVFAAESAKYEYVRMNIDESIYWDTFSDIRYKAIECKKRYGAYGIFVPDWYPRFYRLNIFKFGCMQYDIDKYVDVEKKPYVYNNTVVQKDDFILGIHIPSSGESFNSSARMESYKKAYDFFKAKLNNKIMVCGCHSWLLYPEYRNIFSSNSNIRSFVDEFDITSTINQDYFEDSWRIFGNAVSDNLPEDTSLQRSFKKYCLCGGKYGIGCGVLLFDGEKILTKKEGN